MSRARDPEVRFHETWLGMVQPVEGLVVSLPVLVEAQAMERQGVAVHRKLLELCPEVEEGEAGERRIASLEAFLEELLGLAPDLFDAGEDLPEDLTLYVPEGRQTIRPTLALRRAAFSQDSPEPADPENPEAASPSSRYVLLVWELPGGPKLSLDLDRPEAETGPWRYPPAAKLDRLLRHARVPIGLLANGRALRLVYAPHGESSGSLTFRVDDMATPGGRPILDALAMLLSARRLFAVAPERQLPALLEKSRRHQLEVTNDLAAQVFEALEALLAGFEVAAERDGSTLLDEAARRGDDHLYAGLLTVLLRLVFVLYAEDRGLLPVDDELYAEHLSALALHDRLQHDAGAYPDSMARRFGAWGRLLALFRAIYLGVEHGSLSMPARHGQLFDPNEFPFLEGWAPGGGAPIKSPESRAAVRVPSVDDATVYRLLEKLVLFQGQRLSYRTLDVEQIGSVYEALMGYHVVRVFSPAVCLKPGRFWLEVDAVRKVPASRRARWLQENAGLAKAQAGRLAKALNEAESAAESTADSTEDSDEAVLEALAPFQVKGTRRAQAGRLVVQPGAERRRTSSHYTPRSLSEPIVRRTLEPLLATMGPEPPSERILHLRICDPAMGSGAFLVEACRFLADRLVAAWTREGRLESVVLARGGGDAVVHARRLVAQRCLYGVDKNPLAVNLAKLSLWLVTLAADRPFTFLDHALRHGDSLVGLDFDQIRSFHWQAQPQLTLASGALDDALAEAIALRQQIQELAGEEEGAAAGPGVQREKELLLLDADDALNRVRLLADLVVGAFFSSAKAREREAELGRRLALVNAWLEAGGPAPEELLGLQAALRERVPAFHWMVEFPEIFYAERPDPLEDERVNRAAFLDAFVGNPPFMGGKSISTHHGGEYSEWLAVIHDAGKNGDLSAHFFRRAHALLGRHGTLGLIATNTIAQGDTREAGLKVIVRAGHKIYAATRSMVWPGEANVAVSVVHTAFGRPATRLEDAALDGVYVSEISSRLRPKPERPDPSTLSANKSLSFQGSIVLGMGFTLTTDERANLIAKNLRNEARIFPYLGGEEVNTSPEQNHSRYVINFGDRSLEEAKRWPDLLETLERRVKPDRATKSKAIATWPWWQFWRVRAELYEAIKPLEHCLVTARVTKHLCFSLQPADRVFSDQLYVFPLNSQTPFTVLQSRAHESWARLLGSSMRNDLRYTATDCFENFPFPKPDPREEIPELEEAGQHLYETRAKYMVEIQQGLTQTYNLLKDPTCTDPAIEHLRELHVEMDRAVLTAYGWDDIDVPPYTTPRTQAETRALEAFEDEVIDRLFLLNAERAEKEKILGLQGGKKGGRKGKRGNGGGGGKDSQEQKRLF